MPHTDRVVPPPAVPADAYNEEYYCTACGGFEEWAGSGGREVAGIYVGMLRRSGFRPGETLLDIGTGRGELVAVAVEQGAERAIGVDYSSAAIDLARQTLHNKEIGDRGEVRLADARQLPVDDRSIDLVTLVDVVEHLSPEELDHTLAEAFRVLRPGGRVCAHTMPNLLIYEVTYRLHRWVVRLWGERWPADPRNDYEHEMHVNEQTRRRLKRTMTKAGFEPVEVFYGAWVHTAHLPHERAGRVHERLARFRLTKPLAAADLFATADRPRQRAR